MSLITTYIISSETENIAAKLKEQDCLTRIKPLGPYTACTVDISKADPDAWAEDCKRILENGVRSPEPADMKTAMRQCAGLAVKLGDHKKWSFAAYDRDGNLGYQVMDYSGVSDENRMPEKQFILFSQEQLALIKDYAEQIVNGYKPDGTGWYRRDYIPAEIEKLPLYTFWAENDGKTLKYSKNYANDLDNRIPHYISKALPAELKLLQVCEGEIDADVTIKDGKVTGHGPKHPAADSE